MALILADRVLETCAAPGTGAVTLLGALAGYQSFSSAIGNANTCYYTIVDQNGSNWEVGLGTVTVGGTNTLARTTILASSNSGSIVNFSSGTQNVFVTYPAEKSVNLNASGNVSALGTVSSGTWNATAITTTYGGTGLSSYTAGDIVYYSSGTTLSKLGIGTSGYILQSNGTAPTWVAASSVVGGAAGSNTQVQYNSSGSLAGSANMTFNGTSLTLANDASINGLTVGKGAGNVAHNTVVGIGALAGSNTGDFNAAFGDYALNSNTSGTFNSAFGGTDPAAHQGALGSNTTGSNNSAFGAEALQANTTGSYNTAYGSQSLFLNTTASNNTAVGYQAGYSNTTGAYSTYLGTKAGYSQNSDNNSFVGFQAGYYQTNGANTALGSNALYGASGTSTGAYNTAVGQSALFSNTTASNNTVVGYQAGYTQTTGSGTNAIFGYQAGYSNSTGSGNCFIGSQAGYSTTGSNNTFVGSNGSYASGYYVTTGSNNTILGAYNGNQGGLDIRTASNYIVLSDGSGNPRQIIDSSGNLGLGVTPSAWYATNTKALQIGTTTAIIDSQAGATSSRISNNLYYNTAGSPIYSTTNYASEYYQSLSKHIWYTAPSGTAGNAITFTQAMTLDASGNLLVGATSQVNNAILSVTQTSANTALGVINNSSTFNNVVIDAQASRATTNGTYYFYRAIQGATNKFIVFDSGNVQNTNNSYGAISDIKLKENIVDATPKLDDLCKVQVRQYNLKTDPDHKQLGVIAQELETIFPAMIEELADRDIDGNDLGTTTKSVKYSVFVPMLIKAIQELSAKVAALEEQVINLGVK